MVLTVGVARRVDPKAKRKEALQGGWEAFYFPAPAL